MKMPGFTGDASLYKMKENYSNNALVDLSLAEHKINTAGFWDFVEDVVFFPVPEIVRDLGDGQQDAQPVDSGPCDPGGTWVGGTWENPCCEYGGETVCRTSIVDFQKTGIGKKR